jgi:ribosomal protein S18 acetylase RimI-like enzyme
VAVQLPDGYTARAPRHDDVAAITGLVRDYTTAVVGFADMTEDDVRDDLTQPGVDAEQDARLVHAPGGRLAGYGIVVGKGDHRELYIDVVAPDPPVASWLFGWALDRAAAMGRSHGHEQVTVDHGVYRADEPLRTQARAHGMRVVTTFYRMCVDHDGPTPRPEPPAGVVLRQGTEAAVRESAYAVFNASFADHFGHVPETYDTWHETLDRMSTFDWSQLWVAELDGRPVAILLCNDKFADEGRGHVGELGVLPEARGRGIAKYLLRYAFATDAALGRGSTVLHVDANNTTPALGVYESVGMRPVLVIDAWRARLSTSVPVA